MLSRYSKENALDRGPGDGKPEKNTRTELICDVKKFNFNIFSLSSPIRYSGLWTFFSTIRDELYKILFVVHQNISIFTSIKALWKLFKKWKGNEVFRKIVCSHFQWQNIKNRDVYMILTASWSRHVTTEDKLLASIKIYSEKIVSFLNDLKYFFRTWYATGN